MFCIAKLEMFVVVGRRHLVFKKIEKLLRFGLAISIDQ